MSKFSKLKSGAVTDDQGKMRLHGAFTGGFSAGYFNSVGTIEGFQPSTFVSSRSSRADKVTRTAKDYMEESDESDDSDVELVDEMIIKSGLDNGNGETNDNTTVSDRRIAPHMKIKPSADFVNMEYSLLGDKKKPIIESTDGKDETVRDIYEVNNLFKKDTTADDILNTMIIEAESNDLNSSKRKQNTTSLFSSEGYSYEDGLDGVYNNDHATDRLQYTREEINVDPHLDDDDDDEGDGYHRQGDQTFHKKQRQLSQIHTSVEKWLGTATTDEKNVQGASKKNKRKSDDVTSSEDRLSSELQIVPQFIAPRIRKDAQEGIQTSSIAKPTSSAAHISYNARSDELQYEHQIASSRPVVVPVAALSAPESLALDVNIFDLIKPKDKLKLQSLVTKSGVSSSSIATSGAEKLSQSISSDAQASQVMQTKLMEIQARARLNLINVNLAEAKKKESEAITPAVSVSRPMLGNNLQSDATFAGLQEAFKNRFTSASTASSVHQDSIVKEGMATASEYVAVKQLAVQASENEAASQALLDAAAEASVPAVAAPMGRARREHVKSTRVTALWAPSPLLCKRYNIKPPEISSDRAFLLNGKSKIDSMLDLIQRPEDTSYTVVHTSTSVVKKGGVQTVTATGGDVINPSQVVVKGKKEVNQSQVLSASEANNAMRGGMAHLLKNRFVSTPSNTTTLSASVSTTGSIPPPPAPPSVAQPGRSKKNKTQPGEKVFGNSGVSTITKTPVSHDGGEFLGADMFSRLHNISTSEVTVVQETSNDVAAAGPTLNVFKSIFEESDEENDEDAEEEKEEVIDVPENTITAPLETVSLIDVAPLSQLEILRDRYTSSTPIIDSHAVRSAPTPVAVVDVAPLTSTMFVSRNARATTSTHANSSGFVLGGAAVRKKLHLSTGVSTSDKTPQETASLSFDMSSVDNEEDAMVQKDSAGLESQPTSLMVSTARGAQRARVTVMEEEEEENVPSKRRRVVLQPSIIRMEATPRPLPISVPVQAAATQVASKTQQHSLVVSPDKAVTRHQSPPQFIRPPPLPFPNEVVERPTTSTNITARRFVASNVQNDSISMNALLNENAQVALMQSVQQSLASRPPPMINASPPTNAAVPRPILALPFFNPHLMPTSFDSTLKLLSAQLDTSGTKKKDKKDKKKEKKSSSKHKKEKKSKKSSDKGEKKSKKKKDKKVDKKHRASSSSENSDSSSESESEI